MDGDELAMGQEWDQDLQAMVTPTWQVPLGAKTSEEIAAKISGELFGKTPRC